MQPASSTAFLELRRAIKRDRLIHQALLEGRAADLGIAPSGCQHCGVRHSGHPHLFCFSSKDVDKAFVQAAGRGDLRIVQALLARRTLAEIHRISQAKAKKDKKMDRSPHSCQCAGEASVSPYSNCAPPCMRTWARQRGLSAAKHQSICGLTISKVCNSASCMCHC